LGLVSAGARLAAGIYVAVQRSKCLLLLTIDGVAARNIKDLPAGRREKSASVGKGQHPVDNRSAIGRHAGRQSVHNRSTCRSTHGRRAVPMPAGTMTTETTTAGGEMTTFDDL